MYHDMFDGPSIDEWAWAPLFYHTHHLGIIFAT